MPSLGHGVVGGWPKMRATLVSFSQNRSSGVRPVGRRADVEVVVAEDGVRREDRRRPATPTGAAAAPAASNDHSLRNQIVGSTWSSAASGPALRTVIRARMSVGSALAYSTSTIQ